MKKSKTSSYFTDLERFYQKSSIERRRNFRYPHVLKLNLLRSEGGLDLLLRLNVHVAYEMAHTHVLFLYEGICIICIRMLFYRICEI
jgi:hypothetical protein